MRQVDSPVPPEYSSGDNSERLRLTDPAGLDCEGRFSGLTMYFETVAWLTSMPADDGLGLDELEGVAPGAPETAEEVPERPVSPFQQRSGRLALQDLDLMVQCGILENQGLASSKD